MPESYTEYYDLVKPELDGSADVWGQRLNEDLDKIDAAIRNCAHLTSHPAFNTPLTGNDFQLPVLLPAQPDPNVISHERLAATQTWVDGRILFYLNKFFPPGSIMMWSGAFGSVPTGWTFCDGSLGSPDLRGRFVLCANNAAPVISPWAKEGTLTPYPGEHTHAKSYDIYPGPSTGDAPPPFPVNNAQAQFSGVSNTIPYIAQMYIWKFANW
jgi:hypothetical protein